MDGQRSDEVKDTAIPLHILSPLLIIAVLIIAFFLSIRYRTYRDASHCALREDIVMNIYPQTKVMIVSEHLLNYAKRYIV